MWVSTGKGSTKRAVDYSVGDVIARSPHRLFKSKVSGMKRSERDCTLAHNLPEPFAMQEVRIQLRLWPGQRELKTPARHSPPLKSSRPSSLQTAVQQQCLSSWFWIQDVPTLREGAMAWKNLHPKWTTSLLRCHHRRALRRVHWRQPPYASYECNRQDLEWPWRRTGPLRSQYRL